MPLVIWSRNLPLVCLLGAVLSGGGLTTARGDFETEAGGVEVSLGPGWEAVKEPGNLFVQEQARNAQRRIAASIGSFRVDLSLQEYAAIAVGNLTDGSDSQLDYVARQLGISRADLDKTLASPTGKQVGEHVRKAARTLRFELVSISHGKSNGPEQYEVHSRVTKLDTGQTLYDRQFIIQGTAPHEIVQVSFVGASRGIFSQKDLADAVRPPRR
jgi:hypothetical protein